MAKLFANSGDSEQMPHSAASYLGPHCLPINFYIFSRLQWIKGKYDTLNYHQSKNLSAAVIKYTGSTK